VRRWGNTCSILEYWLMHPNRVDGSSGSAARIGLADFRREAERRVSDNRRAPMDRRRALKCQSWLKRSCASVGISSTVLGCAPTIAALAMAGGSGCAPSGWLDTTQRRRDAHARR
jgi:hypothetical protein